MSYGEQPMSSFQLNNLHHHAFEKDHPAGQDFSAMSCVETRVG